MTYTKHFTVEDVLSFRPHRQTVNEALVDAALDAFDAPEWAGSEGVGVVTYNREAHLFTVVVTRDQS